MHPAILPRRGGTARAGFVGGVLQLDKLHGSVDYRRVGEDVFRDLDLERGHPS